MGFGVSLDEAYRIGLCGKNSSKSHERKMCILHVGAKTSEEGGIITI